MTTSIEAFDDTMSRFKAIWDTTGLPVIFQDVPLDAAAQANIDTGTSAWARITYRPNLRDQTSLASSVAAKYTSQGIVIVEVYAPTGDGGTLGRTLSQLVETCFEGVSTNNGVWYRNTHTEYIGTEGFWTHWNILSDWSYDEVR